MSNFNRESDFDGDSDFVWANDFDRDSDFTSYAILLGLVILMRWKKVIGENHKRGKLKDPENIRDPI